MYSLSPSYIGGIPSEMLKGKVIASAIGTYSPGFALVSFQQDALAAKIDKIKRLDGSEVTKLLMSAAAMPLTNEIAIAKITGNQPHLLKTPRPSPLTMPISSKKITKNPLKRSVVNGFIPRACSSLARNPIRRLPKMSNTLPLLSEWPIIRPISSLSLLEFSSFSLISSTPINSGCLH